MEGKPEITHNPAEPQWYRTGKLDLDQSFSGGQSRIPVSPQRKIQIVPTGQNVAVKGHAEARVVPPEKGIPHVADVYFRINCVVGAVVVDLPQYLLVDVCQFLRMLSGLQVGERIPVGNLGAALGADAGAFLLQLQKHFRVRVRYAVASET